VRSGRTARRVAGMLMDDLNRALRNITFAAPGDA